MSNFLEKIRARKKSGPGSVEIVFADGGEPVVIPLKYPKGEDQARLTAFIKDNKADQDSKDDTLVIDYTDKLSSMMVRCCMKLEDDEEVDDEELRIIVRESGGFSGALVQRCSQLLGLGFNDDEPRSRVIKPGAKKRGR